MEIESPSIRTFGFRFFLEKTKVGKSIEDNAKAELLMKNLLLFIC
jgi:hypothetical protein